MHSKVVLSYDFKLFLHLLDLGLNNLLLDLFEFFVFTYYSRVYVFYKFKIVTINRDQI